MDTFQELYACPNSETGNSNTDWQILSAWLENALQSILPPELLPCIDQILVAVEQSACRLGSSLRTTPESLERYTKRSLHTRLEHALSNFLLQFNLSPVPVRSDSRDRRRIDPPEPPDYDKLLMVLVIVAIIVAAFAVTALK
ncbi:MAG TPA: hypothetical protein PKL83_00520 [bacterium]|nr:hypothetical protein [bacterium]